MNAKSRSILDEALTLPDADRVELVQQLLASLPADEEAMNDDELAAELERRLEDFKRGTADAVTWSEFQKELSRDLCQE